MRGYAKICLTLFLLWLGFILVLDAEFAVSLHLRFYLMLVAVALSIGIYLLWIVHRNLVRICILFSLALLAILPFVNISPRKTFIGFYRSIQISMSYTEVNDLLVKHFPENGAYKRPVGGYVGVDHMGYILDPNDGRYNAELLVLKFDGGKVCSKQYLHD